MAEITNTLERTVYPVLAPNIVSIMRKVALAILQNIQEIRLRIGQPLIVAHRAGDAMLSSSGQQVFAKNQSYITSSEDLARTMQLISQNSLYAFEHEMKLGFLTINGGHRIGLAGQIIADNGQIRGLKSISAMNIRIARNVIDCSDKIIPFILNNCQALNTLLISPPCCGKTTLLRDIVRNLSTGIQSINFNGLQVGVVDERSEIAACENGIPTVDLVPRTDVLDSCPKAVGLLMLIRAMSPKAVVADEIGRAEDVGAIKEALQAGVSVITTVHGRNQRELALRPYVGELINNYYFDRYVILSSAEGPGTVEEIVNAVSNEMIFSRMRGAKVCG